MAGIKIGTFNCENLFARFKFNKDVDPETAVQDGWDANRTHFNILNDVEKHITALAIKETKADVLALQEVENLDTLKRFRNKFLGGSRAYPHVFAVDRNDPRLTDVAVLSKFPVVHARSYQHLRAGRVALFSRDCLEVDIDTPGAPLTLFVNHFKSMLDKRDPCKGRAKHPPDARAPGQRRCARSSPPGSVPTRGHTAQRPAVWGDAEPTPTEGGLSRSFIRLDVARRAAQLLTLSGNRLGPDLFERFRRTMCLARRAVLRQMTAATRTRTPKSKRTLIPEKLVSRETREE